MFIMYLLLFTEYVLFFKLNNIIFMGKIIAALRYIVNKRNIFKFSCDFILQINSAGNADRNVS